jgi:hypothetical protein
MQQFCVKIVRVLIMLIYQLQISYSVIQLVGAIRQYKYRTTLYVFHSPFINYISIISYKLLSQEYFYMLYFFYMSMIYGTIIPNILQFKLLF